MGEKQSYDISLIGDPPDRLAMSEATDDANIFSTNVPADSSFTKCTLLILNTAVGSGMLLLPYCCKTGIFTSTLFSAFFGFLTVYSLIGMIEAGAATHCYDYKGLFTNLFGQKWVWIVHVVIALVQWGACIIYEHWMGHLMNIIINVPSNHPLNNNIFWIFMTTIFPIIPMVLIKDIGKLGFATYVSTVFIVLLITHAIYGLAKGIKEEGFDPQHEISYFRFNSVVISAFSVNAMAYNCIVNLFSTLEHLERPTLKRGKQLSWVSMICAFAIYNIFAYLTYFHFFDSIENRSAVEQYDSSDIFTKISIVGVAIILAISCPLVVWGARRSILSIIFKDKPYSDNWFYLIGIILTLSAAGIASLTENVLTYFHIVGGLFTSPLIFLIPNLFYLKGVPNKPIYRKVIAIIAMIVSVVAMVICPYKAIEGLVKGE